MNTSGQVFTQISQPMQASFLMTIRNEKTSVPSIQSIPSKSPLPLYKRGDKLLRTFFKKAFYLFFPL
jgi:hypothetical protein